MNSGLNKDEITQSVRKSKATLRNNRSYVMNMQYATGSTVLSNRWNLGHRFP